MRMTNAEPDQDLEARDKLVMEHVGLVKALASRLAHRLPPQVEASELVSVGVLGLVNAAGRFNPSLGVPFDAFARRRIQGAMLDSLRDMDWAPRSVRKLRRDVDTAIWRVRHTLGREPDHDEIAHELHVSGAEYDRMLDQLRNVDLASIRQASVDVDGQSALDIAVDPSETPYARIERIELRSSLAQAIEQLPERERHILALYHEEGLTLAEIARVIGVGESRISQLRTQAIARLRSMLDQPSVRKDGSANGHEALATGDRHAPSSAGRNGRSIRRDARGRRHSLQLPSARSGVKRADSRAAMPARPLRARVKLR